MLRATGPVSSSVKYCDSISRPVSIGTMLPS